MKGPVSVTRRIEWTGERCVPWADDLQVIYEHYHRYAMAAQFVDGKRVLDLASGEGYGAAMLAAGAADVVAVDLDPDSVEHARSIYSAPNLSFSVGSITDPDLLSGVEPFDVITCFEALEHVLEQDQLMANVARLLASDGLFLVSTPDVNIYTHGHGHENPFHLKELNEEEFTDLLKGSFRHVALFRQNVAVGSLIVPADPAGGEVLVHSIHRGTDDSWELASGAPHTYLLALASNADHPTLAPAAVLVDPALWLVRTASERSRVALEQLQVEYDELARRHDEATREVQQLRARTESLTETVGRLRKQTAGRAARIAVLVEKNAQLRAENSATAQRVARKYRSTLTKALPRGSTRRRVYEGGLRRFRRAASAATTNRSTRDSAAPKTPPPPVAIATSDQPVVSIIIPAYGKWAFTRKCLVSIGRVSADVPFEVIVVDDCSPDDTARFVRASEGVRLVSTPSNLGFVGACNLGAEAARGELLVFLNNDTQVKRGWLDALVRTVEDDDTVGLVGAKLVFPDGRLQEAGGIIWADGTGWNYGRGRNPRDAEFNATRDVDYCSGAAILVRAELFRRLGGFDSRYSPAYYEDTDLAFAVRAAGYRVVVQPEAIVVHHEGVSHGTDVSAGVKRYQTRNRELFVEKWADQLALHRPGPSPSNLWVARQRSPAGHGGGLVLVTDVHVPHPDRDGGSVRMAAILNQLVELNQRVLFFSAGTGAPDQYVRPLMRRGVTIVTTPGEQERLLRDIAPELRLAILSRPNVAGRHLPTIRALAPHCTIAYDTVDLHFLRQSREADLAAQLGRVAEAEALIAQAEATRELELGLIRASDLTFVVSEYERDLLAQLEPDADVRVLSNVHEVPASPVTLNGRSGVIFVGNFNHPPNRDAVEWLVAEIMPLIRAKVADATLHIVGSNTPPEIEKLAAPGITVHGWVPNLEPLYREMRVAVAPVRYGAGVKGKVGESAALGVPTVGTTIALEGMRMESGRDVLVGDTAEDFAACVVALLTDDESWHRIAEAGKVAVAKQFGPARVRTLLASLLP